MITESPGQKKLMFNLMSNFLGSHQKLLSDYLKFCSEYLKLLPGCTSHQEPADLFYNAIRN